METKNNGNPLQGADKQTSLADLLEKLEITCKNCNPLTPITCVTACNTWKLKNQLRKLHEKTKNPNFMTKLLNTIKNKRRLQLLETIANERSSLTHLQQRLKELGFNHSQQTIVEEYINPLVEVGLADQTQNAYYATLFGSKLSELTKDFHDVGEILPPHSECYEEIVLDVLLKGPKTYENLRSMVPAKSVPRVLSRLQKATLAETSKDKDYIFFFTTRRDPYTSKLSSTEARVYENIPTEGICARRLAEKTGISLRRTYKYLRKLKGKKLVFTKKKPTSYALTAKGVQMAIMLEALRNLAIEALATTAHLVNDEEGIGPQIPSTYPTRKKKKDEEIVPLTTIQPLKES
jgi:predicted transcriptional regulator